MDSPHWGRGLAGTASTAGCSGFGAGRMLISFGFGFVVGIWFAILVKLFFEELNRV